ncbi:MFS general substrate transporter [Stemphylium lycopersici]|nr:mfs multidrug transporter [Stemphylium lycopersici]RAR12014.1 MFS general substrate transporter [Stemphylium lycopersici]
MGMVADMFDKDDQQCAVLWSSIFSCLGTVPGGITGGPVQQYLGFRLIFWIQLILGAFTQLLHLLVAKETRAAILIDHAAKRLRSYGNPNVQGPDDKKKLEGKVSLEGDCASATGGNGFMRDVLAGMCPLYTGPMYKTLSIWNSCLVLFGLGAIFCIPVYVFNSKGPQIRENSKFARKLEMKKDETLRPEGIELRECQTLPNKAGRPRTV